MADELDELDAMEKEFEEVAEAEGDDEEAGGGEGAEAEDGEGEEEGGAQDAADDGADETAVKDAELAEASEKVNALAQGGNVDTKSVYVGNLDAKTTPAELAGAFGKCGAVARVTILCNRHTGVPKGCVCRDGGAARGHGAR